MKPLTKWLTDPDADDFPFPHKIGERLRSPAKNIEGIVRNAFYTGFKRVENYWITYYLQTDTGEILQLPWHELEKAGQPIQLDLFNCNNPW